MVYNNIELQDLKLLKRADLEELILSLSKEIRELEPFKENLKETHRALEKTMAMYVETAGQLSETQQINRELNKWKEGVVYAVENLFPMARGDNPQL